jgi:hypothetical protein
MEMKGELKELKKSNELLSNQISQLHGPNVSESFIMVSIFKCSYCLFTF